MTTVGVAVAGLKDLGALVPVLEVLGAKHKPYADAQLPPRHHHHHHLLMPRRHLRLLLCCRYGVIAAHYDIVGQALLATLESALGDAWTPPVKEVRRRRHRRHSHRSPIGTVATRRSVTRRSPLPPQAWTTVYGVVSSTMIKGAKYEEEA